VRSVLASGGFVDYYQASRYAWQIEEILRRIASMAATPGGLDAVREPVRQLLTGLGEVLGHADDSNGEISGVRQQAVELYVDICNRSALSDDQRRELGEWVADIRITDPFEVSGLELEHVLAVLEDVGLAAYRGRVDGWRGTEHSKDFELNRMRMELADHDGDVDAAIHILDEGEFPGYGGIVRRLLDAGRAEEACDWVRKAVEGGRPSSDRHFASTDSWVDADVAVDLLAEHGSVEEARQAWRGHFLRTADRRPGTYLWLLAAADRFGLRDQEREWALQVVEKSARAAGRAETLIQIRIADGDAEGAWQAADELGAGYVWRMLAEAGAKARPRGAAELYRRDVCAQLRTMTTRNVYASCAADLKKMCRLYARAGDAEEGRRIVVELKETYRRRPAMLDEFRKAGLS
jgi:hypothetical protein